MINFNEQFKALLKKYQSDPACKSALLYLESDGQVDPGKWTQEKVVEFIKGMRLTIKKRNLQFGLLIARVNIIVVDPNHRLKTMAVDQDHNLYINPEFTQRLFSGKEESIYNSDTEAENAKDPAHADFVGLPVGQKMFLGIIAHELMHIYKDHVARGHDKKQMLNWNGQVIALWNIATDLEINDELVYTWGYYLIKGGVVTDPDGTYTINWGGNPDGTPNKKTYNVRGRSPERIYNEILRDLPPSDDDDGGEPGDDEEEGPIEAGEIVFDPATGKYGEVVIAYPDGSFKSVEISRQEARAKRKAQMEGTV
jgi:hypothetical protein